MGLNKIHIIGDSFCDSAASKEYTESELTVYWVDILKEYFKDLYEVLVYAEGSRDLQTILDTWIKILPDIKEDDIIITCIPYYIRYRLPRSEKFYKYENGLVIRHIGQHGQYEVKNNDLEFYDKNYSRNYIHESLKDNEIINSSTASSLNYKEVIESLEKLTKCKTYLFSWTDYESKFKPKDLEDKSDLEKKIKWITHDDVYKKTNKKFGMKDDMHWSEYSHIDFAKYLIEKFKK